MKIIEEKMSNYFSQQKQQKKETKYEEKTDKEPIAIDMKADNNNSNININNVPFAIVAEVTPNSPAHESGLMTGDAITVFDNNIVKGVSNNPLQVVARIANEKINTKIPIKVIRKNSQGIIEIVDLTLIPHTWAGRGILGCKLNLL